MNTGKYILSNYQNKGAFLFLILFFTAFIEFGWAQNMNYSFVSQSPKEIPIIKSVDVVIIGGTTAAVSAAIEAASQGATVFLVAPKLYLGEDICSTLRMEIGNTRILKSDIEKQLFGNGRQTTPLKVKAVLNQALLDANVEFVFGSFVSDILWDEYKKPAGVVIANRAGVQAIKAKSIIDATDQAWVCRMAGASAEKWNGTRIDFQRITVFTGNSNDKPIYRVDSLQLPMADLHFPSFANAEQIAREKTYNETQVRASESLFHVPVDPIICKKGSSDWNMESQNNPDFFQPRGFDNLFVLSGSAGIPRSVADSLLKPAALCDFGMLIGQKAAKIARQNSESKNIEIHTSSIKNKLDGDVRELLTGLRSTDKNLPVVKLPESALPVIASYDVVVIGGGTSGAPAAIAAARMGMKVLVVEYLEGLGGVGTLGLIGKPWHGRNVGFAAEVPFPIGNIEPKMEWYRSEIKKAGGDIWLGVLGCGAYVEGKQVKGAVIATPEGRGVVVANVVIDGTGSGDIAIAAGAEYMYGEIENNDIALQGTGLSSRHLTGNYENTDYLLVDETDMVDVWRTLVSTQITKNYENIYDIGSLIQSRERRRIIGEFELSYLDQVMDRTFPDVIVFSGSDYDSHGYPSSLYFALLPHDEVSKKENHPAPGGTSYTPYRCLIPRKLNGILVTGLGISMHRDASAMVRMQLDLANQGYAAGIAAYLAITSDKQLRDVDVKVLQQFLVEKGNLPDSVLQMEDSFPLSNETIKQAVIDYGQVTNPTEAGKPLAIILTHKKTALSLVEKEYQKSTGEKKLRYAKVLGMCGNKVGIKTLLSELDKFTRWDEKIYQGFMADYAHLPTPIDGVILAIGNAKDKSALPALLKLVEKLDAKVTLSHHRSLALAIEKLADHTAAKPLAELLQKPDMQGHAMLNLSDALADLKNDGREINGKAPMPKRTKAFREIILARVLYECGDYNGIGEKILENYQHDLQGLLARHANSILNRK